MNEIKVQGSWNDEGITDKNAVTREIIEWFLNEVDVALYLSSLEKALDPAGYWAFTAHVNASDRDAIERANRDYDLHLIF